MARLEPMTLSYIAQLIGHCAVDWVWQSNFIFYFFIEKIEKIKSRPAFSMFLSVLAGFEMEIISHNGQWLFLIRYVQWLAIASSNSSSKDAEINQLQRIRFLCSLERTFRWTCWTKIDSVGSILERWSFRNKLFKVLILEVDRNYRQGSSLSSVSGEGAIGFKIGLLQDEDPDFTASNKEDDLHIWWLTLHELSEQMSRHLKENPICTTSTEEPVAQADSLSRFDIYKYWKESTI